jgi:hypothetical protein
LHGGAGWRFSIGLRLLNAVGVLATCLPAVSRGIVAVYGDQYNKDEPPSDFDADVESLLGNHRSRARDWRIVQRMKPLGDRRARTRYDVVGMLFGRLDSGASIRILNVSTIGALLSTSQPMALGVAQSILFTLVGEQFAVSVIPKRIQQIDRIGQPEFHIGVEFVSVPGGLSDSLLSFGLGR